MAGQDRRLDPLTRDYILDGKGGTTSTTSAVSAVYHAAATRLGSVIAAPARGSRLAELRKATPTAPALAEQVTALSLVQLVDAGVIADVDAAAVVDGQRLTVTVTAIDSSGEPIEVDV